MERVLPQHLVDVGLDVLRELRVDLVKHVLPVIERPHFTDSLVTDAGDDTADFLHDEVAGTAFRPPVFLAVRKRVADGIHFLAVLDRHYAAGRGIMLHVIDPGADVDDGLEHRVCRNIVHTVPVHIDFAGAADAVAILVSSTDHRPVLTCHPYSCMKPQFSRRINLENVASLATAGQPEFLQSKACPTAGDSRQSSMTSQGAIA